jgi:hypothetical protein
MTCWVCGIAIEESDASTVPSKLPHRYRAHIGARVHLRCHGEWRHVQVPTHAPVVPTMPPAPLGVGYLFAEDIARLRGVSRWRARRWLAYLEEHHGEEVVGRMPGRRGVRRFTTEAALRAVGPRTADRAEP